MVHCRLVFNSPSLSAVANGPEAREVSDSRVTSINPFAYTDVVDRNDAAAVAPVSALLLIMNPVIGRRFFLLEVFCVV